MLKRWRSLLVVLMLCGSAGSAWSQDNLPRFEIYGGYSLLRPKIPSDAVGGGAEGEAAADILESVLGNLLGWRAGGTANVTNWLGITADFTGHYKSLDVSWEGNRLSASADLHTFLLGPKITRRGDRVSPYLHALFGVGRVSGSARLDGESLVDDSVDNAEFHFSASMGGGVEISVHRNVVVRAIEVDYFPYVVNEDGDTFTLNNIRWGSGVSFRF